MGIIIRHIPLMHTLFFPSTISSTLLVLRNCLQVLSTFGSLSWGHLLHHHSSGRCNMYTCIRFYYVSYNLSPFIFYLMKACTILWHYTNKLFIIKSALCIYIRLNLTWPSILHRVGTRILTLKGQRINKYFF